MKEQKTMPYARTLHELLTNRHYLLPWMVLAGGISTHASIAGAAEAPIGAELKSEPSIFDRTWNYAKLYDNPDNPFVQSVSFTGRYQLDYAVLDRDDYDTLNNRRWRMGLKIGLFENFTIHGEIDLDHDEDPFFRRWTDLYAAWTMDDRLEIKVGKQSAPFTLDGMTSSKRLLTIDRSNLANNLWFTREYIPGVTGSGTIDQWQYHTGLYSSGSESQEFGNFDGKYFILTSLGYDFADPLGVDQALLTGNYVFNDPDADNSFTRSMHHVASLNYQMEHGDWGLRTDVSGGSGYRGQSDLWGATVMPYYNFTDRIQAVLRGSYLQSEDNNGIRFARYESETVRGRGDSYTEIYFGINYYLYGHKLKIQTGVHHADMRDGANDGGSHRGWGWTTGLRVSW